MPIFVFNWSQLIISQTLIFLLFRSYGLQKDSLNFSTNPYSVNCVDLCQVTFIVVILNATQYCNESNTVEWECGLDELERHFSNELNSIEMRPDIKYVSTF